MRPFNEADYEAVKAYEKDFTKAIESRYCTGLLKNELDTVQRIYNETLNRQANLSCGGCVLQMMSSVGRLYFAYKKTRPEDVVKPIEEVTEVITELNDTIENIPQEIVTELIQDDKTEGNDNPEEPVDVLFQEEKPKKERRQRKSKTNEDKTEHKTGEGMPDAL